MISKKLLSIARDLTTKYPKGPNGSYNKDDYCMTRVWSHSHNKFRDTAHLCFHEIPEYREWSGYDPKDLYEIDLDTVYSTVSEAFKEEHLSIHAISRRANVLRERLVSSRDYVRKVGIEGIYRVEWNYNHEDHIYVYGKNNKDVIAKCSVYNGMFNLDITYIPRVKYFGLGTLEHASEMNKKKIVKLIESEERYVQIKKDEYEQAVRYLEEKKEKSRSLMLLTEMIDEAADA